MNKKHQKEKTGFEFCKVCKLNHNQGRRHNYFPNHTKSLSSFLSRFLKKLSDVRFFLKTPTLLRPEHASSNRLWCVFCDLDIQELDSLFVCNNAIRHLASSVHLKNLKDFLWRYGGAMDGVDSFRVSDTELTQWEKKCTTLTDATPSSGRTSELLVGDSKDIHDKVYSDNLVNIERNTFPSLDFSISNSFLPLQKFTNEKIQASRPQVSKVADCGFLVPGTTSLSTTATDDMDLRGMHANENIVEDLTVYRDNQQMSIGNCQQSSVGWSSSIGGLYQVGRLGNGESSDQVLQTVTTIHPLRSEESKENVHSGAPPPWLEKTEENQLNDHINGGIHMNGATSSSRKSGKSQNLNPNRVGAAWAEKRKIELARERRGEVGPSSCDVNWLPNFGRVWQSGSRKESRKEFEMEHETSIKTNSPSEIPIKIQPYISKRMRKESSDRMDRDAGNVG